MNPHLALKHGNPMPALRVQTVVRRTLLFWFSFSVASAQVGLVQREPHGPDVPRHTIGGTVINRVTGQPIARALVELDAQPHQYVLTDSTGAFRFEGVAEGSVALAAAKPDFFKPTELPGSRDPPSNLRIDADVDGIVLKLVPQAVITGRVSSIQGLPIEDFPIHLYRRNTVDGQAEWRFVASPSSSEEGEFEVTGLMPGSFCLSAGPEIWRPRAPGIKHLGYPQVFYPNRPDFSACNLIVLSEGQQVETDLLLNQEPLFEVSGRVVGVPGTIEVKIELVSSSGVPLPLAEPHPERHEFSGYLAAGRYTLRASAEVDAQFLQATVPLNIASDSTGIKVVLGPQMSIPVSVRAESAEENRRLNSQRAWVRLSPTANSLSPHTFEAGRVANREQTAMEIVGVEPGRYSVEISSYSGYAKAATSGSTDLLLEDLLVPASGRVDPIEIVLADDGGEVGGRVELIPHEGGASVLLVPERGRAEDIKTAATQSTGEFHFEQVRPGDYSLLAIDRVDDLEYKTPGVLSTYLSSATHINVRPRQHVNANLALVQSGK
jgi:carboxypeptidase family protein